ncbi:MAG: response regulator [Pirellulales bacterium]|nr:response regulator [Pirellulales bacterium]
MRSFSDLSIRAKLITLVMASGGVALLLCCVGFVFNDVRAFRSAKIRELETNARVLAFNSTAVLTFQNAAAAQRLLDSLRLQPSVDSACLYNVEGKALATYTRQGHDVPPPATPGAQGFRFAEDGRIELFQPVLDKDEPVGTLFLLANTDELRAQFRDYALIAAVVTICSLTVSIVFSTGLQKAIARPILELAAASERITSEGDYSIRVEPRAQDELGNLCLAFNRMLRQIEVSENALQEANEQLEERVRLRTLELEEEINQRKQIQADLERSRDAAEAANRAKSQFLANMSHEIRTPMNAILGFTSLLRKGMDGGSEATRKDYLDTIHSSGKHLLGLINDILDLSKIEAGKLDIHRIRCSPHEIIVDVISVLRVRAKEKGLRLDYEWAGGVPEVIETDPTRLRELLMNLVGNAIKFTKQGYVKVVVRLNGEPSRPQLHIQVIDTGIGIAEDNLQRIFDPFMQADNSVTREFGGTGLGLAICRRIAEALGGSISVRSKPNEGSTFAVVLDVGSLDGVRVLESIPTDAVATAPRTVHEDLVRLPGSRILLVEDGETNRKLIRVVLQRAGARVTCAENGQIGVELALRQSFDLILMDMQMPVLDGYTATARLRRKGIGVPILALTAHAMKGDEEKCASAGCSGYLTKPVDPEVLVRAVAQALGTSSVDEAPIASAWSGADAAVESASGLPLHSKLPIDEPVYRDIVREFVGYLRERLGAMRQARTAGDFETVAGLAHWLKGAGGTAGFPVLTQPSMDIESAAKAGDAAKVEAGLRTLESIAARIVVPETPVAS